MAYRKRKRHYAKKGKKKSFGRKMRRMAKSQFSTGRYF